MKYLQKLLAGMTALLLTASISGCGTVSGPPAPVTPAQTQAAPTETKASAETTAATETTAEGETETETEPETAAADLSLEEEIVRFVCKNYDPNALLDLGDCMTDVPSQIWFQDLDMDGIPEFFAKDSGRDVVVFHVSDCKNFQKLCYPHDGMTNGAAGSLTDNTLVLVKQNSSLYYIDAFSYDDDYASIFRMEQRKGNEIYKTMLMETATWTGSREYYVGFNEEMYEPNPVSAAEFKKTYNDYFKGAVTCSTYTKRIDNNKYRSMSQEDRLQALRESYAAWGYASDGGVQMPLKNIVDSIPDAPAPAEPSFDLFKSLPERFDYTYGVGAWCDTLYLNSDGSFRGEYMDVDAGDVGEDNPNGTVYVCNYSGRFKNPKKVDEYIYSIQLDYITQEKPTGEIYYENGVMYQCTGPLCMDGASELLVYLPGCKISQLPLDYVDLAKMLYLPEGANALPAGMYVIYNSFGGSGFTHKD